MITRYLFLFGFGLVVGSATAQTLQLNRTGGSVVIGSDGSAANASAALEVKSTSQGVLLPRLTTAQRTAISNAANGLLVFDTDTQSFWFRQNGAWVNLVGGGSSGAGVGWQQTGANISTTNSGNVGIGTTNPLAKLSVVGNSVNATGTNTADFANTNLGPNVSFVHLGSKGHWLIRSAADSGNVVMQDINRGRVGIGTAFPNSTLSIVGRQATSDATNTVDISNTAVGPNVSFIHYGRYGDWFIRSAASAGTVAIQDMNGARTGIGNGFPGSTLSVRGRQTGSESNTADFWHPGLGPNLSHIHYGLKGDWFIRSAANDGKVIIQDVGATGLVGLGTASPIAKLHLSTTGENAMRVDGINPYIMFRNVNDAARTDNGHELGFIRTWTTNPFNPAGYYGFEIGVPPAASAQPAKHLMFSTAYNLRMVILDNGNVGIGTNIPTTKLAVNGTIRAKEVIVETDWADFVFARGYRLRPLPEVEQFIRTHRHLPDIPAAATISGNGVALAEVTTNMMQKIEELTLYVIRQDKQIRALQRRLATSKRR
nr:hypothetical protein [uncultured Arsenicibacter sp.]